MTARDSADTVVPILQGFRVRAGILGDAVCRPVVLCWLAIGEHLAFSFTNAGPSLRRGWAGYAGMNNPLQGELFTD